MTIMDLINQWRSQMGGWAPPQVQTGNMIGNNFQDAFGPQISGLLSQSGYGQNLMNQGQVSSVNGIPTFAGPMNAMPQIPGGGSYSPYTKPSSVRPVHTVPQYEPYAKPTSVRPVHAGVPGMETMPLLGRRFTGKVL